MNEFIVYSAREGGRLQIRPARSDRWWVTISLPNLSASAEVDVFAYDDEHTLALLFRRLADDWRGWDGERRWSSLDGHFGVSATHDGLGHVALAVRLRSGPYEEDWLVQGTIWVDAGQLDAVARNAAALPNA